MTRPRKTSMASETSNPESTQELGSMYDYLAKVILLGPSGAGKSCLLHRFLKSEFRTYSSQTIGVEFASKIIKVGPSARRKRIKLQLWDTAGTERFRSVSRSYYRGAAGAILVYDVASSASFEALPTFLMDARALASKDLTLVLAGNKQDLVVENPMRANGHPIQSEAAGSRHPETPSSVSSRQSFFPFDAGGNISGSVRSPTAASSKQTATTAPEGREVSTETASRWASKSNIPVSVEVSALSGENVDELFSRLARMILTKIELGEIDPDDPQSGIQYGDVGMWGGGGDMGSIKSVDEDASMRRRRKGRKRSGTRTWMGGMREWEDVFRISAATGSRRRGVCC